MKKLVFLPVVLIFIACRQQSSMEKPYDVRCDVRLFTKYFSIYINSEGNAYVVKGTGSFYMENLIVKSADTSSGFKLDSTKAFFELLIALLCMSMPARSKHQQAQSSHQLDHAR